MMNQNHYYERIRRDYIAANRLPGEHEKWAEIDNLLTFDKNNGNLFSESMRQGMEEFVKMKK